MLCTGADSSSSLPKQLESLLGPDAQSGLVTCVQVNPVADSFVSKALKQVAWLGLGLGLGLGSGSGSTLTLTLNLTRWRPRSASTCPRRP